jgi:hypothetical protein
MQQIALKACSKQPLSTVGSLQVIKRFILHAKKTAFVVEHDFIMATYLADKVIVYDGVPSLDCVARAPQSLLTGMNSFLRVSCICCDVGLSCVSLLFLGLVCLCVFVLLLCMRSVKASQSVLTGINFFLMPRSQSFCWFVLCVFVFFSLSLLSCALPLRLGPQRFARAPLEHVSGKELSLAAQLFLSVALLCPLVSSLSWNALG